MFIKRLLVRQYRAKNYTNCAFIALSFLFVVLNFSRLIFKF